MALMTLQHLLDGAKLVHIHVRVVGGRGFLVLLPLEGRAEHAHVIDGEVADLHHHARPQDLAPRHLETRLPGTLQ